MTQGVRTDLIGQALVAAVHARHGNDWHAHAACRNYSQADIDRLWCVHTNDANDPAVKEAKRICGECPVQAKCLAVAMDLEAQKPPQERFQIWGGLTPVERTRRASAAAKANYRRSKAS